MKKITLIIALFTQFLMLGQISVSLKEKKVKHINEEYLENLKNSKTIFVFRDEDEENLDQLISSLENVWNYTELEFLSYDEYKTSEFTEDYSFFTIKGYYSSYGKIDGTKTENTHIYLLLWKKINGKQRVFSRIELSPDHDTFLEARQCLIDRSNFMSTLYNKSTVYNWNIANLTNALQLVNKQLEIREERSRFKSDFTDELIKLKKDTLYVADYTLVKIGKNHEPEKLLKKYDYAYKVVSIEELETLVTTSNKPIYYLSYVHSSTDKFVNVVNSKTGDIIYANYQPISYNIKSKDLGELNRAINKSAK